MKKLLGLILFLCAVPAWGTTTFTGTIQNLNTGAVTTGTFVRFWLRGCGGNQPRVAGTAVIAPSQGNVFYFDFVANGSGAVSGTLYSTRDATGLLGGDITCGTSTTSVWYGMQIYQNGKGGPEIPIHAKNGVAFDISSVAPLTTTPVPNAPSSSITVTGNPVSGNLAGFHGPSTIGVVGSTPWSFGIEDTSSLDCTGNSCAVSITDSTNDFTLQQGNSIVLQSGTNSSQIGLAVSGAGTVYLNFSGATSGAASLGVAAVAGNTCGLLLPTALPTAGQFLQAAAPSGSPSTCQMSWSSSLLITGIKDGLVPVSATTTTPCTFGTSGAGCFAANYVTGYAFNQHATAAQAVTYNLPTAAAGKQYCVANSYNGSNPNTGVLTVATSAAGQFIIFTDGTLSASGGNVTSGGAAADAACFVGIDATHWQQFTQSGTWTKH